MRRIEQADFDHVVMQEIVRQVADVVLEHLDALLVAQIGLQARQLPAGLMESVELLLLLDFR